MQKSKLEPTKNRDRLTVLTVGGFPQPGTKIYGGIVTSCRALLNSSFVTRFNLVLIDSTQVSNPPPGLLRRSIYAISRLSSFIWHLSTKKPAAVLLFTALGASLLEKGAMAWAARLYGVPALMFPRGGALMDITQRSTWQRFWIRCAMRGSHTILCQGPKWRKFAIEEMGFQPYQVTIVPNWTATKPLLEIGQQREYSATEKLSLIFVGWLEREKGIFELLEACALLAIEHDFNLTIVGRGNAEHDAKEYVARMQLDDRVHFAGWAEGESLEILLRQSNVFVLPSWAEGLPNAMIEAMSAGLAVVVSSVGNIPDVVSHEIHALLVAPRCTEDLVIALRRIFDSADLRISLAKQGHRFAAANYSVEPSIEVLTEAIQFAVKERFTRKLERA